MGFEVGLSIGFAAGVWTAVSIVSWQKRRHANKWAEYDAWSSKLYARANDLVETSKTYGRMGMEHESRECAAEVRRIHARIKRRLDSE
mgnify:CR=1 FL=1